MNEEEKSLVQPTLYLSQLSSMIEHMPDATVLIDKDGTIKMANQQLERMFLYNHMELIAESIDSLVPQRLRGKHQSHRASFFALPKRRAMGRALDLFGVRKDGSEFPVDISLNPLPTEQGPMVLAAVRDMTEAIQLQEKERIVDKIIARATAVTVSMEELTTATNKVTVVQALQIKQIRRINFWLGLVVCALFLSVFYQVNRIRANAKEIAEVQEMGTKRGIEVAEEQKSRREKIFCPILTVILDSYDPIGAYAGRDPRNYEKTFNVLEQSATHLGCAVTTRANRAKP